MSGYGNHLDFLEAGSVGVSYANGLDDIPQNANCTDDKGLGCTFLQYDSAEHPYFRDKLARADWRPYDGAYRSSNATPPSHMFNVPNSPHAYEISVRSSLYDVEKHTFPATSGLLSYDPGAIADATGVLMYNASRDQAHLESYGKNRLSLDDDFTLEGFFRTNGNQSTNGPMTILQLDDSNTTGCGFVYALDLNVDSAGSFRFAIGPEITVGTLPAVVMDSQNYADGNW
jgi:hypothetical protein